MEDSAYSSFRRIEPRITLNSFCSEYGEHGETHGIVTDLSESGLRVQGLGGANGRRQLRIEFELPDVDEVILADGAVCYEEAQQQASCRDTLGSFGIRITSVAQSHRRLIRDYVHFAVNELGTARDMAWASGIPNRRQAGSLSRSVLGSRLLPAFIR